MQQLWGIDLGGTKVEGVVLDACGLRPLIRLRLPTEAEKGYPHILSRIELLLQRMSRESGARIPACIGIGTPGSIDSRTGRLKNSNTVCLNGTTIRRDLEKLLQREVLVENDANCFALAEYRLGAGREVASAGSGAVFGIILGTGVGGGIICGVRLLHGAHGIAGEWGHNVLVEGGDPCYCGRRGCVETVLSGPALERYYVALAGSHRPLPEIAQRADSDPAAAEVMSRLVEGFGRAVAGVINILDPSLVVIGGGVGNIDLLYTDRTRRAVERHLFNGSLDIPFARPLLGDSAGVFGAALLTANR
ncbi:ROK family protein [Prosthecochloris ethylica]|uniref:ROK family protein n=1 Tax=Prosthecochloris ethylica TaxID=2743976 RepID=UPI0015823AB0|nr:ROK family protein [Prosthecochloris ethylica]NUK47201.1 ROK family protein [Prosthecochloris ethylica]